MTIRDKNSDDDEARLNDGAATLRLREVQNQAVVSRRGVLWRAGLATAAGVGVLAALNEQQAQAATGGNFILGQVNSAATPTELEAPVTSTLSSELMHLDGTNVTTTTLFVNGAGHTGINSESSGTAIFGSSSGGTGVSGSSNSGPGVSGSSNSGPGVSGSSSTGIGVHATSTSGNALRVSGKTNFSRSGSASVAQGSKTKAVTVSGMTSSSLVLVTLQTSISGIFVAAAVPAAGKFTVHLNKDTPTAAKFAWFLLRG